MESLKIPGGKIKYKPIVLYPGIKQIDKIKAHENLVLLKRLLNNAGIDFQLAYGTLLGAIRDHDYITHDEDIDLALLEEDRAKFLSFLPNLIESGFELCRYDRRDLYSLSRNGEYIDFYFFKPYKDIFRICSGEVILEEFLINSVEYEFKGFSFNVPSRYHDFLKCYYGEDWEIPIQTNNYEIPKWKIKMFELKDLVKYKLPGFIFFFIANILEKSRIKDTTDKMYKAYLISNKNRCMDEVNEKNKVYD